LIVKPSFAAPKIVEQSNSKGKRNADSQSVSPQGKSEDRAKGDDTGACQFSPEKRRLCPGIYDDTQETEFGIEESGQSSSNERL
jgi:hypothetical protein